MPCDVVRLDDGSRRALHLPEGDFRRKECRGAPPFVEHVPFARVGVDEDPHVRPGRREVFLERRLYVNETGKDYLLYPGERAAGLDRGAARKRAGPEPLGGEGGEKTLLDGCKVLPAVLVLLSIDIGHRERTLSEDGFDAEKRLCRGEGPFGGFVGRLLREKRIEAVEIGRHEKLRHRGKLLRLRRRPRRIVDKEKIRH